jgi:hypothetical protein
MRKRGSIVCKLRPCLPKGQTNSARMRTIVTAALQRQCLQTELNLWIRLVHYWTSIKSWKPSFAINPKIIGFEVITAALAKNSIYCDITPCSLLTISRPFGGTCGLHLKCRRISRARNQGESRWQAVSCLDLFFHSEDGGDMFLRNVGSLSTDYTAVYSRR